MVDDGHTIDIGVPDSIGAPEQPNTGGQGAGDLDAQIIRAATEAFGGLACKTFYDRTLAKCGWRTSFTESTVVMALDTLMEQGWTPPAARTCPHGDPTCPCQDGDACHYEGDDPMQPPTDAS